MMAESHAIYDKARELATNNLQKCCQEIVDWRKKAILNDGFVREMAEILESIDEHNATRIAEQIVLQLAIEKIAEAK